MKLHKAKSAIIPKPWVRTEKIELETRCDQDGKIKSFRVVIDGEEKVFPVVKFDVLAAWRKLEAYCQKKNKSLSL